MQPQKPDFRQVVDEICDLKWSEIDRNELLAVVQAYYYFSVQYCETVAIACTRHPLDHQSAKLWNGECDTANLSPCPGVAAPGEKMDHDEFMRRVVAMSSLDRIMRAKVDRLGARYLAEIGGAGAEARVMSLPSYEGGGLARVFNAILQARDWNEPSLAAFRHFLVQHIQLDSESDGTLSYQIVPNINIYHLWLAFRNLLVEAAPRLIQ